ncbi:MAG: hypothetical protein FWF05_01395 [Oscillospiraceae bacterium]|nr:hypothetical protein [Oscillospiraceae bacterium]
MKKFLAIFLCMAMLMGVSALLMTASATETAYADGVAEAAEDDNEGDMKVLDLFKYFLGMVEWGSVFQMIVQTIQAFMGMLAMGS